MKCVLYEAIRNYIENLTVKSFWYIFIKANLTNLIVTAFRVSNALSFYQSRQKTIDLLL